MQRERMHAAFMRRGVVALVALVIGFGCGLIAAPGPEPDPNYPRPRYHINDVRLVMRSGDNVALCWTLLPREPPLCDVEFPIIGVDPALVRKKYNVGGYFEYLHINGTFDDDLNLVVSQVTSNWLTSNPATGGTTTTTIITIDGVPTPLMPSPDPEKPTALVQIPTGATGGS